MRWGVGDSRGKIPNTSQTCCAFLRPHVSAASIAPLPTTFRSASLAPIQTAAKRKYKGTSIEQRGAYFIGGPKQLSNSPLDEVLTAARAILARLSPGTGGTPPVDTLPGIKPLGRIKDLSDAITAYDAKNTAQGDKQGAAEEALEAIGAQVADLASLRREIQLAADQAWPWRTPGVKTIRKAFGLPEDRPLPE
ncbi:MAG: hypothetical protein EBS84_10740 [Proteobacteria bacterium]|nr:hypothetical protein [Pseudomonadota bacterium]